MKNYREEARPPFFSNKPRLTPEQRGATGKGPLPKTCCGDDRHVTMKGGTGKPNMGSDVRKWLPPSKRPTPKV